ncbi:Superoxide dismutase [Cu-Zn] [Tyrophagus putrescentiae]|nr:Superoxide dismutase [Cu-Zn] [Tyrophagus putrescentiae]
MKQSTAVNTSSLLLLCLSLAVLAVGAVAGAKRNRQAPPPPPPPLTAVAKVTGSNGAVSGTIKFICSIEKGAVHIVGEVRGLTPGKHGFHVHHHGAPGDAARHVGDLGNIEADGKGVARVDLWDSLVTLKGEQSIVGRGVVIHGGVDDLGTGKEGKAAESKKTGNAGPRVGCAPIAFAKV